MLSWDCEEPFPNGMTKATSFKRTSCLSRMSGGSAGYSSSAGSRRYSEDAAFSPPGGFTGAGSLTKAPSLVREGLHFDGWSHVVDAGHLNDPARPPQPELENKHPHLEDDIDDVPRFAGAALQSSSSLKSSSPKPGQGLQSAPLFSATLDAVAEPPAPTARPAFPPPPHLPATKEEEEEWNPFQAAN